jgi:hypothetical protein
MSGTKLVQKTLKANISKNRQQRRVTDEIIFSLQAWGKNYYRVGWKILISDFHVL